MERRGYRLLLIEDDKLDRIAFERAVDDLNLPYDCMKACSVSEALGILRAERFDVIISDFSLGDGTALDILGEVQGTPVIITTGAGDEDVAVSAWKAGANDYLVKDDRRNYLKTLPITIENTIRHKKAEDKLQLLSGAVMSTSDSVYIADMDDRIIFVNRAFCKTYGYEERDILGKDGSILWISRTQSERTRSVFQTQTGDHTWQVGFYHRRKDGSIFPVSLSRSLIRASTGKDIAVAGLARDISAQIAAEEELIRANRELKRRNQLQAELNLVVSQELADTLSDVKTHLNYTRQDVQDKLDTRSLRNLESAVTTLDKTSRVTDYLLAVSQLISGGIKPEPTEFSLDSVLGEVARAMQPIARVKDVELICPTPDCESAVRADRSGVIRALTALIEDSIESAPQHSRIYVRLKDTSRQIAVEVQANGRGIDDSEKKQVLGLSDWVENHSQCEELSLGLTVAAELVKVQGGSLWVGPRNGQARDSCLTLPRLTAQDGLAPAVQTAADSC